MEELLDVNVNHLAERVVQAERSRNVIDMKECCGSFFPGRVSLEITVGKVLELRLSLIVLVPGRRPQSTAYSSGEHPAPAVWRTEQGERLIPESLSQAVELP